MRNGQWNPEFQVRLAKKESSGRGWRIWPPSVRWQVPQHNQPSETKHGHKTGPQEVGVEHMYTDTESENPISLRLNRIIFSVLLGLPVAALLQMLKFNSLQVGYVLLQQVHPYKKQTPSRMIKHDRKLYRTKADKQQRAYTVICHTTRHLN